MEEMGGFLSVVVDLDVLQVKVCAMNAVVDFSQPGRGAAFCLTPPSCASIGSTRRRKRVQLGGRTPWSALCQWPRAGAGSLSLSPIFYHYIRVRSWRKPRLGALDLQQLLVAHGLSRNDSMREAILAKTGDVPSRNSTDVFGSWIAASKPRVQPGVHPD